MAAFFFATPTTAVVAPEKYGLNDYNHPGFRALVNKCLLTFILFTMTGAIV